MRRSRKLSSLRLTVARGLSGSLGLSAVSFVPGDGPGDGSGVELACWEWSG